MHYRHTQVAPAAFRLVVVLFLTALVVMSVVHGEWIGAAITAIVAVIVGAALLVFSRFTVEVTDGGLLASFGWGWPRRALQWDEATTVRIVRNKWWYGLGIRWFPGGTLWNVWGLDAVEFELVKGSKLRLGSDEPEQLLAALAGRLPAG